MFESLLFHLGNCLSTFQLPDTANSRSQPLDQNCCFVYQIASNEKACSWLKCQSGDIRSKVTNLFQCVHCGSVHCVGRCIQWAERKQQRFGEYRLCVCATKNIKADPARCHLCSQKHLTASQITKSRTVGTCMYVQYGSKPMFW